MNQLKIPRLVIAGTASGVGKTTIMAGVIQALRARGLKVATFKCGPDYLDPTYHRRAAGGRAAGAVCHNLDGWIMGRDAVAQTFARASAGADIALIEGVMGLFDGASPSGEAGSTAEIAKWLQAPVALVIDAGGMARSIAAIALGFKTFDPDLNLAGVIANRVGSASHTEILQRSLGSLPLLGGLPKRPDLAFPERYLGLKAAREDVIDESRFIAWSDVVREAVNLAQLVALAQSAPPVDLVAGHRPSEPLQRCRIGVAMDAGFDFYYEDNLARLRDLGAELVPFSPVADHQLPQVDGLYFGGGYPEAVAAELANNSSMSAAIRSFAADGGPIYAECGGLLYLCRSLRTLAGETYPMVGLLPGEAVLKDKLQALGYVEVETQKPSILGPSGLRFRGHQFRYSLLEYPPTEANADARANTVYSLRQRRTNAMSLEGYSTRNVLASYVHAHWASNPLVAAGFVSSCERYRQGRPC